MIAPVREIAGGKLIGYLALKRAMDGSWRPIRSEPYPTQTIAERAVSEALARQWERSAELADLASDDVRRLHDMPTTGDRIRYRGEVCRIDDDGVLVLPLRVGHEGLAETIPISEALYAVLVEVLDLADVPGERRKGCIVDTALDEPGELLAGVQRVAAGCLGEATALVVAARRMDAGD